MASLAKGKKAMTEQEWLKCTNPHKMLKFLKGKVSDRKLRLFGCACCRRAWNFITDQTIRNVVDCVERFADGLADREELVPFDVGN